MSREPGEAPGLEWKKRARDGARIPRWRARKKAVALGYRPSVIQLKIDANDHAAIAERCREEWAKMEAWLINERPAPVFDSTLASLIDLYLGDEYSPYHDLRYRTQRSYDQQLKLLKTSVGARRVDRLNGEDFWRWYRKLREPKSAGRPPRIAELQRVLSAQRVGPVIKDTRTGQPYKERRFQKNWRAVARAAGIPDYVMNRDSRAGGVTEGSDAGADLEHLRHHASHSSATTTALYSRKTLTKTRAVARLRVAHREVQEDQNGG
jgi:hypothetical protein